MIRDLLHQSPPAYILVNLLYGHHNTLPDEQQNSDTYRYQFKFMDDIETVENDTLRNIKFTIGSNIARMLDKKLK